MADEYNLDDPFGDLPAVNIDDAFAGGTITTPGASGGSTPAQVVPTPSADDPFGDLPAVDWSKVVKPQSPIWSAIDAAIEGGTYSLDKHLYAQFGRTREQTEAQRKANLKHNYWPVQAGYVLGSLASAMVPASTIARVPVVGRALNAILPNVNIGRSIAAPGTNLAARTLLAEGAKGAGKAAVLYGLGDTNEKNLEGGVVNRAQDIAGQAALAALAGAPLNLAGARIGRWLGERGEDLYRITQTARREAGTPIRAGRSEALRAMRRDGVENIDDVINVTLPRQTYGQFGSAGEIPVGPRMAAMEAYGAAQAAGQGVRAASQAARQAYETAAAQEGIQLSQGQVQSHVRNLIRAHETQNAIPINPTEATALATGTPAKNTFMAYQRGVNSPGERGNEAAEFALSRQAMMGQELENVISDAPMQQYVSQRAQELQNAKDPYRVLFDHIRQNPTDDAVLGMRERVRDAIEATRRDVEMQMRARNDDSIPSQRALQDFENRFFRNVLEADGQPPIRLDAEGRPYFVMDDYGNPVVGSDGNWLVPTTLDGYEGAVTRSIPRDSLEALKSERANLQQAISDAFNRGDGELGSRLRDIRNSLDRQLRQAGADPDDEGSRMLADYFAINDNFAATKRSDEAYALGAKFPLSTSSSGRNLQGEEMLARYEGTAASGNMTEAERVWFQRGIMAQIETMLSKMEGTHNPGKKFGNRQMREKIRRIFGEDTLAELDRQVERVNLATRTYGADKNSITHAMREQEQSQNALSNLARSIGNPLEWPGAAYNYLRQERQQQVQDAMMRYLGAVNTGDPQLYYPAMRELLEAQRISQQVHNNPISSRVYRGWASGAPFMASEGARPPEEDR